MGTRPREATGATRRVPPRNRRKQGRLSNRSTGKATEDARETEGSVGAEQREKTRGAKGPSWVECLGGKGGRGDMPTAPLRLQDLQRRREGKAKAAPSWRFGGLDVHVGTMEPLRAAYRVAKAHNGAPGIDGVPCEDIEASGVEPLREPLRDALVARTSQPRRVRRKAIPKEGETQVRVLGMPTIRD